MQITPFFHLLARAGPLSQSAPATWNQIPLREIHKIPTLCGGDDGSSNLSAHKFANGFSQPRWMLSIKRALLPFTHSRAFAASHTQRNARGEHRYTQRTKWMDGIGFVRLGSICTHGELYYFSWRWIIARYAARFSACLLGPLKGKCAMRDAWIKIQHLSQ